MNTNALLEKVAEKLGRTDLTVREVAERAGVSFSFVAKLGRREVKLDTVDKINRILQAI